MWPEERKSVATGGPKPVSDRLRPPTRSFYVVTHETPSVTTGETQKLKTCTRRRARDTRKAHNLCIERKTKPRDAVELRDRPSRFSRLTVLPFKHGCGKATMHNRRPSSLEARMPDGTEPYCGKDPNLIEVPVCHNAS
jgi:hypothetical protein